MATDRVRLECSPYRDPDLGAVETIARLQLSARRRGCEACLVNPSASLLDLIGFAGLGGILRVESGWQAEEREYPCRGKEKGELRDLAV